MEFAFFDKVVPLPLISDQVRRRQFLNPSRTQEEKRQAFLLSLYTLCHSDNPLCYYELLNRADNYNKYCDLSKKKKKKNGITVSMT